MKRTVITIIFLSLLITIPFIKLSSEEIGFIWIIKPEYDSLYIGSDEIVLAEKDKKFIYINLNSRTEFTPACDEAYPFRNGLAIIGNKKKFGCIDKTGNIVIPIQYEYISIPDEGLIMVKKNRLYGYFDREGKPVIDFLFDDAGDFSEGFAPVSIKGKWGYIDSNGKFIIKPVFDNAGKFINGLAIVMKDKKYGFIAPDGRYTVKPRYDEVYPFSSEKLSAVRLGGKWGYVDRAGIERITPQFDKGTPFSEGLAGVMKFSTEYSFGEDNETKTGCLDDRIEKTEKWGFINEDGKTVIEMKYDSAGYFSSGLARVMANNKWCYIDTTGATRIDACYELAGDFVSGLAVTGTIGKFGVINTEGEVLVPFQFYRIELKHNRYAVVQDSESYNYGLIKIR